jgi:hypothetical protein
MTPEELAETTGEFEAENLSEPKPLSRTMAQKYKRAKAKRGRPKIGAGSRAITVSIQKNLLDQVDRQALREGITRSQLIARALRSQLAG